LADLYHQQFEFFLDALEWMAYTIATCLEAPESIIHSEFNLCIAIEALSLLPFIRVDKMGKVPKSCTSLLLSYLHFTLA
jgi:hypothetical protein